MVSSRSLRCPKTRVSTHFPPSVICMKAHGRRFLWLSIFSLFCLVGAPYAWAGPASDTGSGLPQMEGWLNNVGEAIEQAKKNDSLIIVDLYADWCGWCKVLDEKVFSTPRFQKFAESRNFVLLRVDTEDGADGSGLQSRFQAFNLPTTLILDPRLVKVGSISGYAPIDTFLKYIDEQIQAWDVIARNFEVVKASDDADLKRQLAQDLHERGDGERAAELYESVIKQVQPGTEAHAWLHYMTADAHRMARRFDLARDWLKRTGNLTGKMQKTPEDLQERVDLLSFYIAQDVGDCKEAVSSIQTFLAAHPKSIMRRNLERTLNALKNEEACT